MTNRERITLFITLSSIFIISVMIFFFFANSDKSTVKIPLTEFEQSKFNDWTSLEGEIEFLKKIESLSERVNVESIGKTSGNRLIHLVKIRERSFIKKEKDSNRTILVMGTPHGNEPAGREMTLRFIREMALTTNQDRLNFLKGITLLIIPTPNPDSRYYNTRENIHGVNNNRDQLNLRTDETRVIAKVLKEYSPDIIIDLHERPNSHKTDLQLLWPRNLNVEKELYNINRNIIEDKIMDKMKKQGFSTSVYGSPGGLGNEDETILRNIGALRNSIIVLVETAGKQPAIKRVNIQSEVLSIILRHYSESLENITGIIDGAPARKQNEYFSRNGAFYFSGADNYVENLVEMKPKVCGYILDDTQLRTIETHIELFSINVKKLSANSNFISMSQPMLTVIPFLVDERAKNHEVKGVPIIDCSKKRHILTEYNIQTNKK